MRLEYLIRDIDEEMYRKVSESRHDLSEEEARKIAKIIGLSAIKYGDLSNQASKDYIFDIDRFHFLRGRHGPYILYTIVRIKSILAKYQEQGKSLENLCLEEAQGASEKDLMRQLCSFNAMMDSACEETAPHKICAYIYDLANAFNKFYHETKILAEEESEEAGRLDCTAEADQRSAGNLHRCTGLLRTRQNVKNNRMHALRAFYCHE